MEVVLPTLPILYLSFYSALGFFQGLKSGLAALTLIIGMLLLRLTPLNDTVIALVGLLFRCGAMIMTGFARNTATIFLSK